jgi:hypothetical protein
MLLIYNDGEVEVEAFTLMGATTKEGDNTKIGFFGSGNKYAIATLLRKGITFGIYSGLEPIELETREVNFRGETYDQIWINGNSTSLTTRMGPEWETWFALRELICNAKDEGGYILDVGEPAPQEGKTLVAVTMTPEVEAFLNNIGDYLLIEPKPLDTVSTYTGNVSAYAGEANCYRKGISILPNRANYKMLYAYDFENIEINESRVLKYEYQMKERITEFLAATTVSSIVEKVLKVEEGYVEYGLYWNNVGKFSSTWYELLKDQQLCPKELSPNLAPEDRGHYALLEGTLVHALKKSFPALRVVGYGDSSGWEEVNASDEAVEKLYQATIGVRAIGYNLPSTRLGTFASNDIIATYNKVENEVRVSIAHLNDPEDLELTLMEECFHSRGYTDGSRMFEYMLMKELRKAQKKNLALTKIKEITDELN